MLNDATQLHGHANNLASAAKGGTDSDNAFKQKAGTNSEKDKEGTLRKLADTLHKEANNLDTAMGTDSTPGKSEAQALADAVGQDENAVGSLREKLKLLGNAVTGTTLTEKASAVRSKYSQVEPLFDKVKGQESKYNEAGQKHLYEAVEEAWNDFNALYNADLRLLATKLKDAHSDLSTKAGTLSSQAEGIVTAAIVGSPLATLQGQAGALKTAAGNDSSSGDNSLYKKAEALSKKKSSEPARTQADQVISAFETVETQYNLLIAKATEHKLTDRSEVTEVVKAYYEVKNTYYQMLIIYRIKEKAEEFHNAAKALQRAAQQAAKAEDKPKLKDLKEKASPEMDNLVLTASTLKDEAVKLHNANDSLIVNKYLAVAGAYKALKTKPEFTAASGEPQVQNVKTTFEALQKSIENVLKLRVQELSTLAHTLYEKAGQLSSQTTLELRNEATQLAAAAMGGGDSLKEKADDLVNAINSKDGDKDGKKATAVIKAFNNVCSKYGDLAKQPKYQAVVVKIKQGQKITDNNEQKVKAVEDSYNNLKGVYVSILNFTKATKLHVAVGTKEGTLPADQKMWYHAIQLYTKADDLAGEGGVSGRPDLTEPLDDLKEAIGSSENAFGKLQKALSDLKKAADTQEQKSKAIDVINAYTKVNFAFKEVEKLADEYKAALGSDAQTPYTNVENAFTQLKSKYEGTISTFDPHKWKKYFIKYPSMVTQWLNFLTFVILLIVFVTGTNQPGPKGCESQATAPPVPEIKITSVKLAISNDASELTHTITLNPGNGILTHTSKEPITLKTGSNYGTITIKLPGGEIILSKLTIGDKKLTIQNGQSMVSLTKKPNPFDKTKDTPVKLNKTRGATLRNTGGTTTLTLTEEEGASGTDEPIAITGGGPVTLNYGTGTGDITIKGNAINDLDGKFIPDELHDSHKSQNCCIFSKQYKCSNNPMAVWWNIFNILMPLQISLAAIFIYSLHYRESHISRSIVNQPKMSTNTAILRICSCRCIMELIWIKGDISD